MRENRKDKKITMTARIGKTFALIVIIILALIMIIPDKEFSEKENRMLAQMPKFSLTAIKEGTFTSDVESYFTDQFPMRNLWIKIRSGVEVKLGKYQANGVYKCDDGYLFEEATAADATDLQAKIDAINAFKANYDSIRMTAVLVPNATNIMADKLPQYAEVYDQNGAMDSFFASLSDGISKVDLRDAFRASESQLYYRTDHHWTDEGAYLAFTQMAPSMWLSPDTHAFNKLVLTDDFSGTLASKSGFSTKSDIIKTSIPVEECQYIVSYVNEGLEKASIFWPEKLKTNDKYTVFFGGNYAQVDIRTANPDRGKLLIIKDSYANSLVPYLLPYYGKIVMVDPRYYSGDIHALMRQEDFTEVLFLYNANTFFGDTSLVNVIEGPSA